MKQECPTYPKTIRKNKALAATLSDTKPEDDSDDNNDERILPSLLQLILLMGV